MRFTSIVVADVTTLNFNLMFKIGYAMGLGIPVLPIRDTQIVDLYHAREHLWKLARAIHPNDQVQQKRWMMYHQNRLDKGRIEKLVNSLRSIEVRDPAQMLNGCVIPSSATNTSSSGLALLKPVAKPSLVPVPNSQACFGQYAGPTPTSPCAAARSTAALKTTGRSGEHHFHFHVAHLEASPQLTPLEEWD
jgi:hypothetical protein